MREAYIVTSVRTPVCKKDKGAFAHTRPERLLAHIISAAVEKAGIEKQNVEDIITGCAFPEAEQGLNISRNAALIAGFPVETTGATINRLCSSGLEAIAMGCLKIMSGWADIVIGAGVESMTRIPMGGNFTSPDPDWAKTNPDTYVSMGITAENVASRYSITREEQDEFAYHSHMKAVKAQTNGLFNEIIETPAVKYSDNGKSTFIQKSDDGIRSDTSIEKLSVLRPAFAANGTVTAGNSSQMSDGAAATLIMSEEAMKRHGLSPLARFGFYTTVGVKPDEMGVGPAVAIPELLKKTGLNIQDIGCWEINEAFASQIIYSIRQIGLGDPELWKSDSEKRIININGGAIALGHPLGCTGAKLAATLIENMKGKNARYGVESMCIGGGMGAAALFELCD